MEFQKSLWYRGRRVYKLQSVPPYVKVVLVVKIKEFGAIDTMGSSRYFKAKLVQDVDENVIEVFFYGSFCTVLDLN